MTDPVSALHALAQKRARIHPALEDLEAQRIAIVTKINALKQELDAAERQTREYLEAYVHETGDLTPHPAVQVRRVQKWVYDKDAVLAEAQERGAHQLVRIRRELNVPEFERQLKQGFIKWADAEQVNDLVIAIDTRLGDLLIMEGQS